jgi:hypothetical protein
MIESQKLERKLSLLSWKIGNALDGVIVDNFEKLQELLPENSDYGPIRLSARYTAEYGFLVYSRTKKNSQEEWPVAGYDPDTKKYFIGSPKMTIKNGSSTTLSFIYYCPKGKHTVPLDYNVYAESLDKEVLVL